MKKLITTLIAITSITVMAGPHGNPRIHHNNRPPRHHIVHNHGNSAVAVGIGIGIGSFVARSVFQQPPPPPPRIQIWIPEQRIVTTDAYGRHTVTVIPGHWEYR